MIKILYETDSNTKILVKEQNKGKHTDEYE